MRGRHCCCFENDDTRVVDRRRCIQNDDRRAADLPKLSASKRRWTVEKRAWQYSQKDGATVSPFVPLLSIVKFEIDSPFVQFAKLTWNILRVTERYSGRWDANNENTTSYLHDG